MIDTPTEIGSDWTEDGLMSMARNTGSWSIHSAMKEAMRAALVRENRSYRPKQKRDVGPLSLVPTPS